LTIAIGHQPSAILLMPLAMAVACSSSGPASKPAARNLVLITIDTLRADHVGAYGYAAAQTRALDALAASGLRFTAARSAVPLTLPSHATIHTGLLPPMHGVRANGDLLADTHQTIATLLKAVGYHTAAFVGAFVLDRRFGLAAGFDTYDDQIPRDPDATERLEAERPASAVVDRALAWLTPRLGPGSQSPVPFFLWLHLYDPHAPYNPPGEFRKNAPTPYDGEIAYADSQIARVLEALRGGGRMDRTVVVVAGDHGEGLGEHGERTHGMLLYDSTLRVPLIIAAPGHPPSAIDEAVSLSDVAPTLLRAAGVTPPDAMKGRDLLSTVRLKADTTYDGNADLYSETEYPRVAGWSPLQALTDGRWKTIRAGAAAEIYDLLTDPREQHDVSRTQAAVATAMTARIDAIRARAAALSPRAVSADVQERLRSLGYVAGSTQPGPASAAPNPAGRIAAWNQFEDALSALSAHRPEALGVLKTLAAANPDAVVIQATYARALKEAGQMNAALTIARQAARRWSTDADVLHDLAVAAREAAGTAKGAAAAALHDEAARADQAALTLNPNSAPAFNGTGLLAIDAGEPAAAAKAFERAAAIDPNNASYWANLGNARRALGDRTGAEQAYRRALDVEPRTADAANGLGVLLVEANRPVDAVPWFERAVTAAPDLVEARLNLGIAFQGTGNAAGAAEANRLVLSARGNHPREKDAAARLLASLGGAR
jgi:choline-sulfatase